MRCTGRLRYNELKRLSVLFESAGMSLSYAHGCLAGFAVAPEMLSITRLIEEVLENQPPIYHLEELDDMVSLIVNLHNYTLDQLCDDRFKPLYWDRVSKKKLHAGTLELAREWCTGFVSVVGRFADGYLHGKDRALMLPFLFLAGELELTDQRVEQEDLELYISLLKYIDENRDAAIRECGQRLYNIWMSEPLEVLDPEYQ